jgi:ribosomal protein S18 acetylase RimI-like enzyme
VIFAAFVAFVADQASDMAKTSYTTRPATKRDAEAIASLWRHMANQHRAMDAEVWCWTDDAVEAFREHMADVIGKEGWIILVAETPAGEVVGFVAAEVKHPPPVYPSGEVGFVGDLVVHPKHRRKRIAEALMRQAFERMRGLGAKSVTLHTALSNPGAIKLYESLGMRPVMYRMFRRL